REVAAGHELVLRPVDGEVVPPLGLVVIGAAVGRNAAHKSSNGSRSPTAGSSMAERTSMCWTPSSFGTIMFPFVVIVCRPNLNVFKCCDFGRRRSISSRGPNQSAPDGQTLAHIGFRSTEVRS